MRIQHNIMALNAYRQLGGNNSALAKNLEKLSSGYAINRAGDDAAGLAISEKMRAQIKGLEAAQKNANDGISLVQTAEGALTEVHSMLNRMVYMATQSANGTYDNEVDRASLDEELQTLKEEIDRISKATNFNGLKLLDGSMDADATRTTGGTTDVPILQNVATNPTTEVGTATVLHEDAPTPGPTEITVELHNVAITSKSQEGDVVRFQVGDNTIELELEAKTSATDVGDPENGRLVAGQTYSSEEIAKAIIAKFNEAGAGNNLIQGQEFRAQAGGSANSIKFVQSADPKDPTEVVNANVDVNIEYAANPNGNPVEYTAKIKSDALTTGNKITIGGDQLTIGAGKLAAATDLDSAFGGGFETDSGYKVEYDATSGTLTVTDPNGTLGAPALKYDGYSTALKAKGTETKGVDATTASGTVTFAGITGLGASYVPKNGDSISINGEQYDYDGTDWTFNAGGGGGTASYTVTNTTGGVKVETVATGSTADGTVTAANVTYTMAADATGGTAALAGGTNGKQASATGTLSKNAYDAAVAAAAGGGDQTETVNITGGGTVNLTIKADGSVTVATTDPTNASIAVNADADGNYVVTITADDVGAAGDGTYGAFTLAGGEDADAATGNFTLDFTPANGDTIDVDNLRFTFNGATWDEPATGNTNHITVTGTGKTLTITKGGDDGAGTQIPAGGFNGDINVTNITPASRAATADLTLAGGADATNASLEFNLDSANLSNGDKVILTLADGSKKELVFDTDLATSMANANVTVADLVPTGVNAAATVTGNRLTITGTDATTVGENDPIPTFKLETAKKEDTSVTMTTPANADSITGTWNVQSTQTKQGAAENGGQLASTTFDLTADMVKDGNSLTIGKETYVFKVGADSTTKAAPGQTIIDLSNYKADDEGLIDAAGAALANQTGNKAFTIGYADNGKISIHEKEAQTQYTNGELESVEEFDKLVYMNSPEVTENTGKGLTFQVGDTADDYQKVALSIHDMSSAGLGIADVSIATIDDAAAAIDKIKAAINTVSSQRGDLGAIQNRLEHTINNLGVQTENITAAESRIRDTDMAQEMMAYTKNNILVQAAQAMLAQANQVPQGILQLLQ